MYRLCPIKLWRNLSLFFAALAVAAALAGTLWSGGTLATHWGADGAPNQVSPTWVLWLLALLSVVSLFTSGSFSRAAPGQRALTGETAGALSTALTATWALAAWFPSWRDFALFTGVMACVPAYWFLTVRLIDFATSGIGRTGDCYTLRYSSGYSLHTVVLPKRKIIPDCVTAGLNTVAVRMPRSQQARDFLRYCDVPVAAPSANTSSRPSPTTWQAVKEDMDGRIAAVLCGSPCDVGIESTVVDMCGEQPLILRPGIVTADMLEELLGKKVRVVTDPKEKVNSPGVRYKHYAPKVPMALELEGDEQKLKNLYLKLQAEGKNPVLLVENPQNFPGFNVCCIGRTDREVSRNLFSNLRALEKNYGYIIASFSSKTAFAQSILNRLVRSASHNVV